MTDKIDSFEGTNRFLSNFHPSPMEVEGHTFSNVEAAFQAHKYPRDEWHKFDGLTPGQAKRLGRKGTLPPNWDEEKVNVMSRLLKIKFSDTILKEKLLSTREAELVEGNTWGDTYWGVCAGEGQNMLGKLLMELRKQSAEANG
jgi:N-glycosidase YbiA